MALTAAATLCAQTRAAETAPSVERSPVNGGQLRLDSSLAAPLPGGAACCPDYWIVSSRRCRQTGRPSCPAGDLDYYHVDAAWRMLPGDGGAFQQWFVPGVPVCVIVHGSFTDWDDAIEGSAAMYRWVRSAAPEQPLQVVFFTWPSDSPPFLLLPQFNIGILGRRAGFNGFYLSWVLDRIPPGQRVCLFGHSHGARVVSAALHLRGGGSVLDMWLWPQPQESRTYRVVLAAAAMDRDWLAPGDRYGHAACLIESLVNVKNRNDLALRIYPFRRPLSNVALGSDGFSPRDVLALRMLGREVFEFDVTWLLNSGHLWENYSRRPEIARSLVPWLYSTERSAGGESSLRSSKAARCASEGHRQYQAPNHLAGASGY